jgi:hypothetical protein
MKFLGISDKTRCWKRPQVSPSHPPAGCKSCDPSRKVERAQVDLGLGPVNRLELSVRMRATIYAAIEKPTSNKPA